MVFHARSSVQTRWIVVIFIVSRIPRCDAASVGVVNSTRSDCQPLELSHAELSVWLRRHHHLAPYATATDGLLHHPSGSTDHGADTLCDPSGPQVGRFHNRNICDGVPDCASSRDELHCDSSLCPYRRVSGVSMKATGEEPLIWRDLNLHGCARVCNDVHEGCVAFSFRADSVDGQRCQVFLRVGAVLTAPGSELFVRNAPSEPQLHKSNVTSFVREEATPSAGSDATPTTQLVRSLSQGSGVKLARRRRETAGDTKCGAGMFKCSSWSLAATECVPYSQVCDGKEQCPLIGDETLCDANLAKYARQRGRSIVSSLQLQGVSRHACAAYCIQHIYEFPTCDSFSYREGQRLCKFGCSWCSDAADIVEDAGADYYKYRPFGGLFEQSTPTRVQSSSSGSIQPPRTKPTTTPSPVTARPPTAAPLPGQSSPGPISTDCGHRPLSDLPGFDIRTRVLTSTSSQSSRRVVGGQTVTYGSYPWQAQIQAYGKSGHFEHHCGGALIGERLVLTAAHCLRPALTQLQVKLGQHDRRDAAEQYEQTFAVENALTHPGYRSDPARGDVDDLAVLKLRLRQGQPVRFSSHVQPLCLPTGPRLPVGTECHISGWGKTDPQLPDSPDSAADVLHGALVPLVSDGICAAAEVYGGRFVPGRMVCAGHLAGGPDSCQGDSGGPLACPSADGRWQLTGIVSFGEGCGSLLKPGVYTRVEHYVQWIRRVVQLL